jgi:DNA-binding NarL/FixJ family response regulator
MRASVCYARLDLELESHLEARMKVSDSKPLTPALRRVLEASITLCTTDAKTLAAHLNRSPATIRTEFQRILLAMNVHSRYAALRAAEERGLLRAGGQRDLA